MSDIDIGVLASGISPVEKFREFLGTRGLRLTRERSTIVEEVFSNHEHFDTDQLVARLSNRTDGRNVSRSTVYRRLQELVEAGLLRRVARHNGREVYEHDYGYPQHDHFICHKCNKLIEFHNTEISQLLDKVSSEHGFRISGHRLEVYGLCDECCRPQRQQRHRRLEMI